MPWAEEAADIRSKAEQLRTSVAQHRQIEASSDPGAQLAAFYQFFSGSDSITDVLATLYEIAARNNLILDRADYNLASTAKGQLQRYEINFPVRGRYVQLRDFVAQALAKNPHLALTGISFTRTTATEIGVEAQVRFVLYLKDGQ